MSDEEKKKILELADKFSQYKDTVGTEYLNVFKYLKTDLSAWFNSLTVVCFSVGAVALTFGADKAVKDNILHPGYFWLGAFLLILNGVLIFGYKKMDIEGEFSELPSFRKSEAEYWKAEKILREMASGQMTRAQEYELLVSKFTQNYKDKNSPWGITKWLSSILKASMTDITFGLLLFPLLLMSSQFIDVAGLQFSTYVHLLAFLLAIYLVYSFFSSRGAIQDIKAQQSADRSIQGEIIKDND